MADVLSTDRSSTDEAGPLTEYCAQKAVQTPRNLYANIFTFFTAKHQITACVYHIYNRKYTVLPTIIHLPNQ